MCDFPFMFSMPILIKYIKTNQTSFPLKESDREVVCIVCIYVTAIYAINVNIRVLKIFKNMYIRKIK